MAQIGLPSSGHVKEKVVELLIIELQLIIYILREEDTLCLRVPSALSLQPASCKKHE
jgi:hypothetical protein